MPFKKKYKSKSKKRTTRKSKKRTSVKKIVQNVLARKIETKKFFVYDQEDVFSTYGSPSSTECVLLNNPPKGNTGYERIGDIVRGRSIDVKGHLINTTSTGLGIRVMLVCTKTDATVPPDELFETDGGFYTATSTDIRLLYAKLNSTKYRILANRLFFIGASAGHINTKLFHLHANLKDMKMEWDQAKTTPMQKIYLVYFSRRLDNDDDTVGITAEITYNSKFYYHDA